MSDETIRVVYDVTERGMENVRKLVGDIRKELGNSGVDTSRFESRLSGLERTVQKVTQALKNAQTASTAAGVAGEAGAKKTGTAWRKAKDEIDAAIKLANRGINAGTKSQNGTGAISAFKDAGIAQWDAQFAAATASAKKFETATKQAAKEAETAQRLAAKESAAAWEQSSKDIEAALRIADRGVGAGDRFQRSQPTGVETGKAQLARLWDEEFAAASRSAKQFEQQQGNIIAQRYALYDVATTYGLIGTALAGAAIYASVVGAQFESAFTNVERTLQGGTLPAEVDAIRASLVQLSGQIPLTFAELSQIATIGNQMGIAKEDVVDFTGTIARFASVSGMSIESVTKAFGGFMAQTGLAPQYLENLGASVAKVGIDSNATEDQIVSLMREITAGAKNAGFAADQIVGLSGTLAGLQIAPERARGALSTYFNTLNSAVAEGGDKLANFATIVGVTSDELDRMVRNGEGGEVLRRFLEGLNNAGDNVQLTQALDALNLSQLRVSDTFIRLSGALSIYDRDQRNANQAFIEGAELQRQYAMTVDDLASQWTIFVNNLNGVVDAISGGAIPGLAALFTAINSVLSAVIAWLGDNRWVAALLAFGGAVAGALGVIILFRAASLTATAALLALRVLTQQAGASAVVAAGGFRGLIGTLFGVQGAANAAAGGIFTLRAAIRALLASTGIGLLVTLGGSLIDGLMGQDSAAGDAALSLEEYNKAVNGAAGASGAAADGADDLARSLGGGGGGGGGGVGGAADSAAKKVRTLVDYVNDLTGVFRRSSDIRFGSAAAMDEITLKWIELNEEAEKYQREIRSLTADRELQQYWLGIANLYDDQVRASQLREGIAKIDDDLAKAQQGASRELEGNSRAAIENRMKMRELLGGYEDYVSALASAGASQEEIQRVISSLNGDFTRQAQSLGFAGGELITYQARFSDLAKIVDAVPRDITIGANVDPALQALQEFFAKSQADAAAAGLGAGGAYGDGFTGGLGTSIDQNMPAVEESINSSTDTIGTNFQNFLNRQQTEWGKFFDSLKNGQWWEGVLREFDTSFRDAKTNFAQFAKGFLDGWGRFFSDLASGRWFYGIRNAIIQTLNDAVTNLRQFEIFGVRPFSGLSYIGSRERPGGGSFAGGGFTGPGHWLEPAGVVHKGEYVIPKKYVNQSTGLPDPSYVNSLRKSKSAGPGYAMGGHVSGGGFPGYMELGPLTLHHITNALQVRLGVDGRELASTASRGDSELAWQGSN